MLPPATRDRLIPADDVRRMTKFACLLGQCPGRAAMQEAWGSKGEGTEILTSVTADELWPQTSQHISLYIYASTLWEHMAQNLLSSSGWALTEQRLVLWAQTLAG